MVFGIDDAMMIAGGASMLGGLFGGGGGGAKGGGKAIKPELPSPETVAKYIFPIGTKENPGYPGVGGSLNAFPGAAQYAASTMLPMQNGGGGGGLGLGIAAGSDILSAALGAKSPTVVPSGQSGLGAPVDLGSIGGSSGGFMGMGGGDWAKMALAAAKYAPFLGL